VALVINVVAVVGLAVFLVVALVVVVVTMAVAAAAAAAALYRTISCQPCCTIFSLCMDAVRSTTVGFTAINTFPGTSVSRKCVQIC
jgi:putative alpha-1,2-mannosidase